MKQFKAKQYFASRWGAFCAGMVVSGVPDSVLEQWEKAGIVESKVEKKPEAKAESKPIEIEKAIDVEPENAAHIGYRKRGRPRSKPVE